MRKRFKTSFVILLLIAVLGTINVVAHKSVNTKALLEPQFKDVVHLPKQNMIRLMSLGFEAFLADLYLIKAQMFVHDHQKDPDAEPIAAGLFDIITTLDPKYYYAYFTAYYTLSNIYGMMGVADAIRLMKRGFVHLQKCDFPRWIGIAYYTYGSDPVYAATYLKTAIAMSNDKNITDEAERKKCYEGLIWMADAAAANKKAGVCTRKQIVCSQLQEFQNKKNRPQKEFMDLLTRRCVGLHILCELEHGIEAYKQKYSKCPKDIDELLSGLGVKSNIPAEPFGGYFYIDQASCQPKSSTGLEPVKKKESKNQSK